MGSGGLGELTLVRGSVDSRCAQQVPVGTSSATATASFLLSELCVLSSSLRSG